MSDNWDQLTNLIRRLSGGLKPNQKGKLQPILEILHEELSAQGFDMWRVALGVETLHPVHSGDQFVLLNGEVENQPATREVNTDDRYINSPTYIVDETWQTFRWRAGESTRGMGLLKEFEADGVTDYLLVPLPFQDISRTATISTTTRGEGGYSDAQVDLFHLVAKVIAPYAERIALREVAYNVMKTYVGSKAGPRVLEGDIDRGTSETIKAAIMFGDLRGYTAFTNAAPVSEVVRVLNTWLEIVGDAVRGQGGEILKFMGDGVMSIFPVGEGTPQDACERALAAAHKIDEQASDLPALNTEQWMKYGLGLHIGDVSYGNVGSKIRLDFTVIGPAVNLTSRIESATKPLGCEIIASEDFQRMLSVSLRSLGAHRLAGFQDELILYDAKASSRR